MRDVDTIKERLSITDVVGAYTKLESAGAGFKARCPFHNEKSASFHVTPSKNMYYCFGCGRGGDIFAFVQEIESLDFYATLKILADRAGVTLSGSQQGDSRSATLYRILDDAAKLYEVALRKDKEVVEYLTGRGVSKESLSTFRVGYAPAGWSFVTDYLKKKGYKEKDLIEVGLSIVGKKSMYDRFRERIMFPISDTQGRVVGFSGRIFAKEDSKTDITKIGKYVNTNDTVLYDKSKVLYGYHHAKRAMMQRDRIVVTEGQLDLIMSHQAGIAESVAISGTALTSDQVRLIERFTDHVILAFDGDGAGVAAVTRSLETLLASSMYVSVVTLPPGKDPADIIAEDADAWAGLIDQATDYFSFRLGLLANESRDERGKRKVVHADIYPLVAKMTNMLYRDKVFQNTASVLGVSDDAVRADYAAWVGSAKEKYASPKGNSDQRVQEKQRSTTSAERLVALLLWLESQKTSTVEYLDIQKEYEELAKESIADQYASDTQVYDIAITKMTAELDEDSDMRYLLEELYTKVHIEYLKKNVAITKRALGSMAESEEKTDLMHVLHKSLKEIDELKTKQTH